MGRALAALAERQHGLVALRQLSALGLTPSGVRSRVAAGNLQRIHAGIYAVGHRRLTAEGRWMAAALACGPGAVVSHRSAGELHGLLSTARATIDVTSPRRTGRGRAKIRVHRATLLRATGATSSSGS